MTLNTSTYFSRRTLWLLLFSCGSFLLLFQGRWAVAPVYGFDEGCYLEYLHKWLSEPFPVCYSKSHFWGVALTWLPVGLLVKLLSLLFNASFSSWIIPAIGLTSFIQWVFSLLLLDRTAFLIRTSEGETPHPAPSWTLLALLCIPVTLYAFRWNFFSHSAELFLVASTFYFSVKKQFIFALSFALATFATRLNDIFILPAIVILFLNKSPNPFRFSKKLKLPIFVLGLLLFSWVLFTFWKICFVTGYNGFFLPDIIRAFSWDGLKKGLIDSHHGLLWHDFIWLISLFYFGSKASHLTPFSWVLILWQLSCLFIHASQFIFWGFSENRLLIGSYVGLFYNLLLFWPSMNRLTRRFWSLLIVVGAFWRTWYFIAATAPGLRHWQLSHAQPEVTPIEATLKMLSEPIKTFQITAGLSPFGFSLFSWAKDWSFFSPYDKFKRYALQGPSLWLLTSVSVAVFVGMLFVVRALRAPKFFPAPQSDDLNHPDRLKDISNLIQRKEAIRSFYIECYERYKKCLEKCPESGLIVEIGSGAGFSKTAIPEIITTDVIPYPHLDRILDATNLPFEDESVRAFFLLNTFHHIADVEQFLAEAQRCLKPDGRLFIIDQNVGHLSKWILKYAHHEPFDDQAASWKFKTDGPLSGANGALTWIVFRRDVEKFKKLFPFLEILRFEPHSPLFYWLAGGLKPWSLIHKRFISFFISFDRGLNSLSRNLGSFVDVEIKKV